MPSSLNDYRLTDEQQALVEMTVQGYHDSRDAKADYMRKAIEWFKWWNRYVPKPKDKNRNRRARTSAAQGFTLTEHTTAKIKEALFPANAKNPIVRALPTEMSDVDLSEVVENMTNYDLRKARIRHKSSKWLRNFSTFGTAPVFPFYRRVIVEKTVRDPIMEQNPFDGRWYKLGLDFPLKRPIIVFEGFDFDVCDITDYYPDPAAEDFDPYCMRYVTRVYPMDYEKLKTRVYSEPDFWDRAVFDMINPNELPPLRETDGFQDEITRYHQYPTFEQGRAAKGMVEVMEYLTATRRVVVINRKYPIANVENPYWKTEIPCCTAVRLPITNYPWGKGVIEPIEKDLAYSTALKNAKLDTINLAVNPPWLTLPGMMKKEDQLTTPNKFIEVVSLDAVKALEIPDYTASVHADLGMIDSDMREVANLPPFAQGINQGSNIRSTGQQLSLLEMVSERTQMDIDDLSETGVIPLAGWAYAMRQQFMTTEQNIRVAGEDGHKFIQVRPEDLSENYDFTIEASARTTPKAVEAQNRLAFANLIAPILLNPTGFPEEAIELYKSIAMDIGYTREAKILHEQIRRLRAIKIINGGVFPGQEQPAVNGGAKQQLQGGNGAQGSGTALNNQPDGEALLSQMVNGALPG